MRILSITPLYEPEGGGLERYAHEILRRLVGRGHEVDALAFTRREPSKGFVDGVHVQRLRPWFWLGNAPIHLGFAAKVRAAIRRQRPDVMVAHTPVPGAAEAAFSAARAAKIPFVTTYHSGRMRGSSPPLQLLGTLDANTVERRMLRGSARLIAVSPYVRDHALASQAARVTVIPPGVDATVYIPNGAAPGEEVLFVAPLARSYRWKGLDVLWDAFRLVQDELPEARLTLVGEGDRFAEMTQKARRRHGIQLLGRASRTELIEAYRRAAVTVLPSTTDAEAFGMVLAEANACGRPVVASRIGGIPGFVRDGHNGLLAAPGDPADLSRRLLTVLRDPALGRRMGHAGRTLVVREHDWDALTSTTLRVLQEAAPTPG